ncbi:hypothetical protein [uncultured Roseibium sp.]|uniref:hypothetical protein n=1 Tax=uncultured Roseibium sp. TaxID=1936171 RepID=UPI0032168144
MGRTAFIYVFGTLTLVGFSANATEKTGAEVSSSRIHQYQIGEDGTMLVTLEEGIGGIKCNGVVTNKYVILNGSTAYDVMTSTTIFAATSRKVIGIEPEKCSDGGDVIPRRLIFTF